MVFTFGILWLLAMTCLHNAGGAFKSKYWKLHSLINVNCDQTKISKCVLGNNPAGWMGILVLAFLLTHCPRGSPPSLWEMLSWDGFGFELTRWQLLCFCIYVLWFMNKPNTRWFLLCYKQEPRESSPSWAFAKCNWAENWVTPMHENSPPEFWAQTLSLLVLSVTGGKWWLLCSGFFAALDLYKRSPACQIEYVAFFYSTWSTDFFFPCLQKNGTVSKTTFPYPLGVQIKLKRMETEL